MDKYIPEVCTDMFKAMLVDDEKYDALLVKRAVDWEGLGLELCAEAQNGQRALELALELRPDIVITDIVMPRQNGIAFTGELKKHCPNTHIVFISGHQEFDYARYGIAAGIDGYLLKPVRPDELNGLLGRILARCIEEKRRLWEHTMFREQLETQLPFMRDIFLNRWMLSEQHGAELESGLGFYGVTLSNEPFCAAVISPDAQNGHGEPDEYRRQLKRFELRRAVEESLGEGLRNNLFGVMGDDSLALLTSVAGIEERLHGVIADVLRICGISVTAGVGSGADALEKLPESYRAARTAVEHRFFCGGGQVIFYDGVSDNGDAPQPDIAAVSASLAQAVINSDEPALRQQLERLRLELRVVSPAMAHSVCAGVISMVTTEMERLSAGAAERYFSAHSPYERIFRTNMLDSLMTLMQEELTAMSELLAVNADRHLDYLVDSIRRYIDENLDQPLTVESIAAQVNLSRGYATQLFKKRTGEPINRYLVGRRMEKAKELLAEQTLGVADIGRRVGYDNPSYFASVFKNEVGVVPREYRDRFA